MRATQMGVLRHLHAGCEHQHYMYVNGQPWGIGLKER